jgi:hypothetical protein
MGSTGFQFQINYTAQASLPPLVLPEDDEWPVFVTLMTSVSSVHVKLVDDSNVSLVHGLF